MSVTIEYPYPENAPQGVQPTPATNVTGTIPTGVGVTPIKGFIPGREYTLVITGFDGHTESLYVEDAVTGELAPVRESETSENWSDVIMMPTDTLHVDMTVAGTGDLNLNAVIVAI
jgi:hypothetical protein